MGQKSTAPGIIRLKGVNTTAGSISVNVTAAASDDDDLIADPLLTQVYAVEADPQTGEARLPIDAYSLGRWRGVLAVEGIDTGDFPRRQFAPGALAWRDLPLTLTCLFEADHGTPMMEGAKPIGHIETIERVGNEIVGTGWFDMDSEDGREAQRMVWAKTFRGLSVTCDDTTDNDVEEVWPEPTVDNPMPMYPERVIFNYSRIMDVCLLTQPAMQEAYLELVPNEVETATPPDDAPAEVAAAAALLAATAPVAPPRAWFEDPKLDGPSPIVEVDGHVFGHLAAWGTCHTSFQNTCVTPPREDSFDYFLTGEMLCADGSRVPVGQLTLGTGHAPGDLDARPAAVHYDHTGHAVADVTCGADRYGIWVSGALRPSATDEDARVLRASALSGDWRRILGKLRLVAALVVNVPGFPIPRMRSHIRNGVQTALIASAVVSDWPEVPIGVADRIARSIGRDHETRIAAAYARVHGPTGR